MFTAQPDDELSLAEYAAALAFGASVVALLLKVYIWDRMVRPRLWSTT